MGMDGISNFGFGILAWKKYTSQGYEDLKYFFEQ